MNIDYYAKYKDGLHGLFPGIDLEWMVDNGFKQWSGGSLLMELERNAPQFTPKFIAEKLVARKNIVLKCLVKVMSANDWARGKLSHVALKQLIMMVKSTFGEGLTNGKILKSFRPDNDIWKLLCKFGSKKIKKKFLQRKRHEYVRRAVFKKDIMDIATLKRFPEARKLATVAYSGVTWRRSSEILYTGPSLAKSTAHITFTTMRPHVKSTPDKAYASKLVLVPIEWEGSIRKLKRIMSMALVWPYHGYEYLIGLDNKMSHKMRCDFEFYEEDIGVMTSGRTGGPMTMDFGLKEANGFTPGTLVSSKLGSDHIKGYAIKSPKIIKGILQKGHYEDSGTYCYARKA